MLFLKKFKLLQNNDFIIWWRDVMKDDREVITIEDFRQRFCDKCYWSKNNGCDIKTVTLDYCCHSQVERWKYKIT